MMPEGDRQNYVGFDGFRVDLIGRRLWKGSRRITVTSKVFDLLSFLIENRGRTLTKEELMKHVWVETFVDEGNLNKNISMLRKALGDSLQEQKYIRTIPKVGYRFTPEVTEASGNGSLGEDPEANDNKPVAGSMRSPRFRYLVAALIGVILVGVGTVAYFGNFFFTRPHRGATNEEAQSAFDEGRRLWQDRSSAGLHEATLLLQTAVHLDPEFALAHSALADAYAFDYQNWRMAEAAARRAIELDPSLGEPHASIGFVRMFWEWDLNGAETELREAVMLSPRYATARQWYALSLAASGHVDGALLENEKALEIEPGSFAIRKDRCQLLYFSRQYAEAESVCRDLLASHGDLNELRELLYRIYMSNGQHNEAVAMFVEFQKNEKDPTLGRAADNLLNVYRREGIDAFRKAQADFHRNIDRNYYRLARVLTETGDLDGAETALRNAVEVRNFEVIFYASDPVLYPLRTAVSRKPISGLPRLKE